MRHGRITSEVVEDEGLHGRGIGGDLLQEVSFPVLSAMWYIRHSTLGTFGAPA